MITSHKCEVKIAKAQEATISSEIDTILSERTIGQKDNEGFLTHSFPIPKGNGTSHFII